MIGTPERTEAPDYFFKYIDWVPAGDICTLLADQRDDTYQLLRGVSAEQSSARYEPGKWSIRELLGHVNDAERLFVARAWWFARGFDSALPSFDQNVAAAHAGADERDWSSHVEEFMAIRADTVCFFRGLPADAWLRGGTASGNYVTVRALAFITAGHVIHHTGILREKYLNPR